MFRSFKSSALVGLAALLTACAAPVKYDYTAFRKAKPQSIVVLPPLNESPDIKASYSFLSSVTMPLAESGYYVFPVALVDQTFKENGLQNPGEMHQAPLPKLREIFGADAGLFITITKYGSSYTVLDSQVVVSATARLVDLRDGELLWQGRASASDAEGRNNSGGLVGALVGAVVRQIVASAREDAGYPIARITSNRLLKAHPPNGLLYGPRSPFFEKD